MLQCNNASRKKQVRRARRQVECPPYDPHALPVLESGSKPATKTRTWNGKFLDTSFDPRIGKWRAEMHSCPTLDTLEELIHRLICNPMKAIILGEPIAEYYGRFVNKAYLERDRNGRRQIPRYYEVKRQILPIDLDGLLLPPDINAAKDPDAAIRYALGWLTGYEPAFENVSCLVQLTSSYGLDDLLQPVSVGEGKEKRKEILVPLEMRGCWTARLRIWAMLDRPYSLHEMKRWGNAINMKAVGAKEESIIDTSPYQPVGLFYTAKPIFEGMEDPFNKRLFRYDGRRERLTLTIPDEEAFEALSERAERVSGLLIGTGEGYGQLGDTMDERLAWFGEWPASRFWYPLGGIAWLAAQLDYSDDEVEDLIATLRARARALGASDPKYSQRAFLQDRFRSARESWRAIQEKQEARLIKAPATGEPAQHFDFQTQLADARTELEEKIETFTNRAFDYTRMRKLIAAELRNLKRQFDLSDEERAERRDRIYRRCAAEYDLEVSAIRKAPALIVRAPTGVKKTETTLDGEAAARTGLTDIYTPTLKLAAQMLRRYDDKSPERPGFAIRGRNAPDNEGRLAEYDCDLMCGKTGQVDAAIACNIDTSCVCGNCEFRNKCGYLAQFPPIEEEDHRVTIRAHPYLTLPSRRAGDGDLVVIDEDPTNEFFTVIPIPWNVLKSGKLARAMAEDHRAESWARRVFLRLARAMGRTPDTRRDEEAKAKRLPAVKHACKFLADWIEGHECPHNETADVRRQLSDSLSPALEIVSEDWSEAWLDGEHIPFEERFKLRQLIEEAKRCLFRGTDIARQITESGEEGKKKGLFLTRFQRMTVRANRPLILLDAYADPDILSSLFGRPFEMLDINLPERGEITQVTGITGSQSSLLGRNARVAYEDTSQRKRDRQDKRLGLTVEAMKNIADGEPCFVSGHMAILDKSKDDLPENFKCAHFGSLRGLNDFRGFRKAIILGRQLPPPQSWERESAAFVSACGPWRGERGYAVTLEDHARAVGEDPGDIIHANGYLMDGDGRPYHPDVYVESRRKGACENEIRQAVGRLRTIDMGPDESAEIYLFTDLPIEGLAPDKIVHYSKLIQNRRAGNVWDAYEDRTVKRGMAAMAEGRIPAVAITRDAETAATTAHDMFKTVNSARRARSRAEDVPRALKRAAKSRELTLYKGEALVGERARSWTEIFMAARRGINDLEAAARVAFEYVYEKISVRKFRGIEEIMLPTVERKNGEK